jgi:PEP-CTERM motif
MAMRLALSRDSFRLPLAPIAIAALCAAFPEMADAGQFIKFTTPKAVANGANTPTDLQIDVTNGAVISKGTAVLPGGVWPAPGKAGNGIAAGDVITFNVAPGSALAVGDVVTGTISLKKGVANLAVTAAQWSYPIPLAPVPFTFGKNAVEIAKLDVGGGGTGLEGEVVVTNDTGATEYFSNFLLSYNIPEADFVDTGDGLENLTVNNLYISSGVPVSASLTSLAAGASAVFMFGLDTVDKYDYIAFSFDAYSSPSLSSADYLGSLGYASNAVPEPSTWTLLVFGFAGLGYAGRQAQRARMRPTAETRGP